VESNSLFFKIDNNNAWIIIRQLCRLYDCKIIDISTYEEYEKLESTLRNIPLFTNKKYIFYIYCSDVTISSLLPQIPTNNYFVFTNNYNDVNTFNNFINLDGKVNIKNNISSLLELYLLDINLKINFENYHTTDYFLSSILHNLELLYITGNNLDNKELSNIISNKEVNSFNKLANDIYLQNKINYDNYKNIDPIALATYIQRIAINKISRSSSKNDEKIVKILFQIDSYIKKYPDYGLFILDQHIKSIC